METIVKKHQQEYYKAIAQSDAKGDSTDFIVFMLKCILQTISEQQKVTDDVGVNVGINVGLLLGLLSVEHNKVQRIKHRIGAIFVVLCIKTYPNIDYYDASRLYRHRTSTYRRRKTIRKDRIFPVRQYNDHLAYLCL